MGPADGTPHSSTLSRPEQSSDEGNHQQNGLSYFSFHFSDSVPSTEFECVKWTLDVTELKICIVRQDAEILRTAGWS